MVRCFVFATHEAVAKKFFENFDIFWLKIGVTILFIVIYLSYKIADKGADKPRTTGGQPADKFEIRGQYLAMKRPQNSCFTGFRAVFR